MLKRRPPEFSYCALGKTKIGNRVGRTNDNRKAVAQIVGTYSRHNVLLINKDPKNNATVKITVDGAKLATTGTPFDFGRRNQESYGAGS